MKKGAGRYGAAGALLLVAVAVTSGCATKRYVRTEVNNTANEISAKMDEKDRDLQGGIQSNSNQISELSGVTREHTQQIGSLDSGLKATDEKAGQAMGVGQGAQNTANKATTQVTVLGQKFENRNNYKVVSEESVPFKFGSAKIEDSYFSALGQIAQHVKSNPDAILVLEGHTDSVGDDTYNIQLGEKRLDAVLRYLVVEQAVPMHQVYKMSFGEERPITANDTKEGRAQNRSVVLRVMGPNSGEPQSGRIVSEASPR